MVTWEKNKAAPILKYIDLHLILSFSYKLSTQGQSKEFLHRAWFEKAFNELSNSEVKESKNYC